MNLFAHNPTRHDRARWVVFGAPLDAADEAEHLVLESLPEHRVCAARVRSWRDNVALEILEPPKDFLTKATAFTIGNGLFRPALRWGPHDSEVWTFLPVKSIYDTPVFKRLLWELHVPDRLHAFLWTDLGAGDSVMPFELRIYFEEKNLGRRTESLVFGNELPPHLSMCAAHTWFAPAGMVAEKLEVGDGQGIGYVGAFLFYHQEPDLESLAAETEWPLFAMTRWERFGLWKPPSVKLTQQELVELSANVMQERYKDPLADCGAMHPPAAATTGEHAGFGFQGLVYPAMVARPDAGCAMLFATAMQATRQACRPIHFYDALGQPMVPAEDLVSWSEDRHYDRVVSPNRLGRSDLESYKHIVRDWTGQDREHDGCMHVFEDAVVRGSSASRHELAWKWRHWLSGRTLESEKPGWSTNGSGNGRSKGRSLLTACLQFLATGDRSILERMRKVLIETMLTEPLHVGPSGYTASTIYVDDDRVFDGQAGHVCWEDALLVPGFDAAQIMIRKHLGDTAVANEILDRELKLASSLVQFCFFPNDQWPIGAHLAYHILWRDGVPPEGDEWQDRSIVNPSIPGTAVTKWAEGALRIVAREGGPQKDRALELLQRLGQWSWFMKRYEGVA